MTKSADRIVICEECGKPHRAIHRYDDDEYYVVGQRDAGESPVCEKCGSWLDIFNQDDQWTPED